MVISSLTSGAPSLITDLSAPVFGILGLIGFLIFAIGGKQDSDGQGTNSSPYLKASKTVVKSTNTQSGLDS